MGGGAVHRGCLAVDIFFILSGFVIAHAYDRRLGEGTPSLPRFAPIRLLRLYPVFPLSLALCGALWIARILRQDVPDYDLPTQLAAALARHALFLPAHMAGSAAPFPVYGPYWSLWFALAANILYGLARPLLSRRGAIALLLGGGLVVAVAGQRAGNLDFGYDRGAWSMAGGLAHALFGFFVGLLLHQSHEAFLQRLRGRVSPWLAIVVVAAVLASPGAGALDPWLDPLALLLVLSPVCAGGRPAAGRHGPPDARLGLAGRGQLSAVCGCSDAPPRRAWRPAGLARPA